MNSRPVSAPSQPAQAPRVAVLAADVALAELRGDAESFSPLGGRPLLVVDAEQPAAVEVGARARRLPCVSVAVAADVRRVPAGLVTTGFDILLTDTVDPPAPWVNVGAGTSAAVATLAAAVAESPFAAVALAQLLRVSTGLDVRDAVVAESFAYSALQAGPEFAGWLARRRERELARATSRPALLDDLDSLPDAGGAGGAGAAGAAGAGGSGAGGSGRGAGGGEDRRGAGAGPGAPTGAGTGGAAGAEATDVVVADAAEAEEVAVEAARERARAAAGEPRTAGPAVSVAGDGPAVLVERDGGCLTVILNRPRVHNAVSIAVRDGLVAAFGLAAADDDVTAIRLAGSGPSFSSGGDLTEFGTMLDPVGAHAVRTTRSIPLGLLAAGVPVTAYVHGRCIGAGAELPAFAGRVVAAPDATFRLPEVAMGLVPGAGGTASIPRRIGPQRAAYLILSGLAIDAEQALAWGLVDEIAPRSGMPGAPDGSAAPAAGADRTTG